MFLRFIAHCLPLRQCQYAGTRELIPKAPLTGYYRIFELSREKKGFETKRVASKNLALATLGAAITDLVSTHILSRKLRPATSVADEPQQCLIQSFQPDTRVSLHFPSVGLRNRTTRGSTNLFVATSICRYPAINFPGRLPVTKLEIKGHTPRVGAMHLPRGSPRGGCEQTDKEDTLLDPDSQLDARDACCN